MIVKNEEDWIENALGSVRSVVDEIILADTGSTDSTLRKARQFSPKVLHFKWTDSFADARNFTLAEARHPWILVLDADECIAARDLPLIEEAVRHKHDGYHLIQRNYVFGNQIVGWTPNSGTYEEGKTYPGYLDNPLIRLFRNDSDIRFRGSVHEIIDPTRMNPNFRFDSLPVVLHHYGKVRDAERVTSKQHFYLDLGKKKIQEDEANPKAHFDLGIQYQELQRHNEAIQCFEKSFEMSRTPLSLFYAAISEKLCGRYDRALELLQRAGNLGCHSFEVHLELGNVQLALNHQKEALAEYRKCLKMKPDNPVAAFNIGFALRKMGDECGAQTWYCRALELDPTFKTAALELAIVYATNGKHIDAADLLSDLLARNPEFREARLTLAKTFIQSNQCAKALATLEPTSVDDAVARSLIGAALLQQGDIDAAQNHLEWAIRRDRSLVDARINLSYIYSRKGDFG
ncbi:MAG TPA: tetratricopeptide repeat protein, partial [Terriglobia bacterium]|nr:tetratricopeptide repeat protein [Terriglobia bacterium]